MLRRSLAFNLAILAGLVGILGFTFLIGVSLFHEHKNRLAHASIETENITRVLDEHARATIQGIDLTIRDVIGHLRPSDIWIKKGTDDFRVEVLHRLLKNRIDFIDEADIIHITNADGDCV
jgi:hypothetical protein